MSFFDFLVRRKRQEIIDANEQEPMSYREKVLAMDVVHLPMDGSGSVFLTPEQLTTQAAVSLGEERDG